MIVLIFSIRVYDIARKVHVDVDVAHKIDGILYIILFVTS